MKLLSTIFLFVSALTAGYGQQAKPLSVNNVFAPKPPKDSVNIIYYKFHNGIQMVELDFRSLYEQNIFYHEQTRPRAMPWSMLIPPPHPNVYLFRNESGGIIKAYNLYGLKPEQYKLKDPKKFSGKELVYHSGNYLQSAEARRYHNLFYERRKTKPYDVYIYAAGGRHKTKWGDGIGLFLTGAKYGLIDTTGKIILNTKYDFISDFESIITVVVLNEKQGLINNKGVELLPCTFDNIEIQEDVAVAYSEKKSAIYDTSGRKINMRDYENEINFFEGTSRVFIKGMGYGVIDTKGNEICPLEFDIIEELAQEHLDGKRYYYARKAGKEYYISQTGIITEK